MAKQIIIVEPGLRGGFSGRRNFFSTIYYGPFDSIDVATAFVQRIWGQPSAAISGLAIVPLAEPR